MMNWIWSSLIAIAIVVGIANGRINEVSRAALTGAGDAVALFLILLATICLWNGLMKIAEKSGVTKAVARLLSPLTRRLFPDIDPKGEAMQAMTMNMTANFLGLGNAATPLGLRAMKRLNEYPHEKGTATNSMAMFLIINTASLQLVPTTIAAIRIKCGSAQPFSMLPCIWITSIVTLCTGVLLANLFSRRRGRD